MLAWLKSRTAEPTSKAALRGIVFSLALVLDGTITDWRKIVVPVAACLLAFVYRESPAAAMADLAADKSVLAQTPAPSAPVVTR